MKLETLQQPPFNTSLLGVLRGAADYVALDVSTPMLFGGTGHAFLMNIHPDICPSGPYVWRMDRFFRLAHNVGLDILHLGYFHGKNTTAERAAVESRLQGYLDDGIPCGCLNLDHQLVTGYDASGFLLAQPWGADCPTTPARLTFNSWAEFGDEVHVAFYALKKGTPAGFETTAEAALRYAVDLYRNPLAYTDPPYAVGRGAYNVWIDALEKGDFNAHGAWWNAMVWSECRQMAAGYLTEIAAHFSHAPRLNAAAGELAQRYDSIAALLLKLGEKEGPQPARIAYLQEARDTEEEGIIGLEKLSNLIAAEAPVSLPAS